MQREKDLIDRAIEIAAQAHQKQFRKGTDIPYITHPYAVGMLLLRAGCSDEVVIAGLLHDTLEDTVLSLDEIRRQFGEAVSEIVKGCSEPDRSLPWEQRKERTIVFLRTAPIEIRWVVCADKLHNIRSMMKDFHILGDQLWKRFHRGRKEQGWYYRGIVQSLWHRLTDLPPASLFHELKKEVDTLFGT
ncbi:MAG: HD domain-containing protein [bacterium]